MVVSGVGSRVWNGKDGVSVERVVGEVIVLDVNTIHWRGTHLRLVPAGRAARPAGSCGGPWWEGASTGLVLNGVGLVGPSGTVFVPSSGLASRLALYKSPDDKVANAVENTNVGSAVSDEDELTEQCQCQCRTL